MYQFGDTLSDRYLFFPAAIIEKKRDGCENTKQLHQHPRSDKG